MPTLNIDNNGLYIDDIADSYEILKDLNTHTNTLIEPIIKDNFQTAEVVLPELEKDNITGIKNTEEFLCSNYSVKKEDLPADLAAKGVEISRNITLVYVSEVSGKFVLKDKGGHPVDIQKFNSFGSTDAGKRKVILNEVVFVAEEDVLDAFKDELKLPSPNKLDKEDCDKINYLLSPKNEQKTLNHELDHIRTYIDIKEAIGNDHPEVSPNNFIELCCWNEISASLAPLVQELKDSVSEDKRAEEHDWFYSKYKNTSLPDINTPEGQETVLIATIQHWAENNAAFYAKDGKQFYDQVQAAIKQNPYSLTGQPDSEYFKKIRVAILKNVSGINFSSIAAKDTIPNPIKIVEPHFQVGEENWFQKSRKKLEERLKKLADWGVSKEVVNGIKSESLSYPYTTTAFEYTPLPYEGEQISEKDRETYRKFFNKFAHSYDINYNEDEQAPYYKLTLSTDENNCKKIVDITIDHNCNITMQAKENGEKVVPDQLYFDQLVLLTKQQNRRVVFGNITSPEYAARLYLACLKNGSKMVNAPEINDAFLSVVSPETAQAIKNSPSNQKIKEYYKEVKEKLNKNNENNKNNKDVNIAKEANDYYAFCIEYDHKNLEKYAYKHHLQVEKTDNGGIKMTGDKEKQTEYVTERRNAYMRKVSGKDDVSFDKTKAYNINKDNRQSFYQQVKDARNR